MKQHMVMAAALAAVAAPAAASPSIQDLAWLIGRWQFADKATEDAGFSAEEIGTRSCAYALDAKYIHCQSAGSDGSGKVESSSYYFAYDPVERRFEMVALHSDWPHTLLFDMRVVEDGKRIELLSKPYADGSALKRLWGILTYDGGAGYVWETGSLADGGPRGPVQFRETAVRARGGVDSP